MARLNRCGRNIVLLNIVVVVGGLILAWVSIGAPLAVRSVRPLKQSPIHCSLILTQAATNIKVEVELTNVTDETVAVFRQLLLEETNLTWSPFQVYRGASKVAYTGNYVNSLPPTSGEFYKMSPHEVWRTLVDIASYYDISKRGEYRIQYLGVNPAHGGVDQFLIRSEWAEFAILDRKR
jgi:hypothetical protein